ncbi:hypothetical protein SBA7_1030013 [Candidatus Sulfotelmatobacter sp. SbA7]|nr:hypothetical protein SBA7_1030013 [Candidatus Sulfotelmatobacter sp. SbA7]
MRQFFVNGHREFSSRQSRFYRGLGTRYRWAGAGDGTKVPKGGQLSGTEFLTCGIDAGPDIYLSDSSGTETAPPKPNAIKIGLYVTTTTSGGDEP